MSEASQQPSANPEGSGAAGSDSPVARALGAFGGVRPMAAKLGVPVTTVQGWKERGHIPAARIPDLLAAAASHGVALTAADLDAPAAGSGAAAENGERAAAQASAQGSTQLSTGRTAQGARAEAATAAAVVSPPPHAIAAAAPSPRGSAAALWAIAVAALVLAAAVSLPTWGPALGLKARDATPAAPAVQAGDGALVQHLEALTRSLAAVEGRLAGLEAAAGKANPAPAAADTAALAEREAKLAETVASGERRTAALESALAALASRPQAADESGKLAALESGNAKLAASLEATQQRLAALEASAAKAAALDGRHLALVLAVGELRAALQHSEAYDKPLAAVAGLSEGDAELAAALAVLKPAAAKGVPTFPELAERFDGAALAAARAAIMPAPKGWLGATLATLARLVVIRKNDGQGGGSDAALARAEALLRTGDLAAAVAALAELKGPPAEAMAPWLADAKARLAADAALARLESRAIARLGESRS